MRTVWKHRLEGADSTVETLGAARIVHAGLDAQGDPCVWVEGWDGETTPWRFVVVLTGGEVPGRLLHVGTFIRGGFVGHVYAGPVG